VGRVLFDVQTREIKIALMRGQAIEEKVRTEFQKSIALGPTKVPLFCSTDGEIPKETVADDVERRTYTTSDANRFAKSSWRLLHKALADDNVVKSVAIRKRLVHRAWIMRGSDGRVLDTANLPSLEDALTEAIASMEPKPEPLKEKSILMRKVF